MRRRGWIVAVLLAVLPATAMATGEEIDALVEAVRQEALREAAIQAPALDALAQWSAGQGLPGLSRMGLPAEARGPAAKAAAASSSMKANPVALTAAELEDLLAAAS